MEHRAGIPGACSQTLQEDALFFYLQRGPQQRQKKRKKRAPVHSFPKKTACSSYVQPWLVAVGSWRLVAVGGWRLATGGWWRLVVVGGGWWLVIGGWWRLAVAGSWRLVAAGGWWRLVVGVWWRLVVGGWWLAVGGPLGRSLRAVPNKKKISLLKDPPVYLPDGIMLFIIPPGCIIFIATPSPTLGDKQLCVTQSMQHVTSSFKNYLAVLTLATR